MTLERLPDVAKTERAPPPATNPVDLPNDRVDGVAGGTLPHRTVSGPHDRWGPALITATGSVMAALIVTWGACHVADIFEPSLVRLSNVVLNLSHIVEIVDTSTGCNVIMSTGVGRVSLDWAGCLSLRRALDKHTVSGIGRVTDGEVLLSALAQASFITATGDCPTNMERFLGEDPSGERFWLCQGSVAIALRLAEGPPWPESWKSTGLIFVLARRSSCPEGMIVHSDDGDWLSCCFGLASTGEAHAGHSSG